MYLLLGRDKQQKTSFTYKCCNVTFLRQGWYTTADFVDRMWNVHHQPVDHWRALQLHVVLQQLSLASDLDTCKACVKHEFIPAQCSQQNQSGSECVALLVGHKGTILLFIWPHRALSLVLSAPWFNWKDKNRRRQNFNCYTGPSCFPSVCVTCVHRGVACTQATICAI